MRIFLLISCLFLEAPCYTQMYLSQDSLWKIVHPIWHKDSIALAGDANYIQDTIPPGNIRIRTLIQNTLQKRRIAPSPDAYMIIYSLNSDLLYRKYVPSGVKLKMPEPSQTDRQSRKFLRRQYKYYNSPGKKESDDLTTTIENFITVNEVYWKKGDMNVFIKDPSYNIRDSLYALGYVMQSAHESIYRANRSLVSFLNRNLVYLNGALSTPLIFPGTWDTVMIVTQRIRKYFYSTKYAPLTGYAGGLHLHEASNNEGTIAPEEGSSSYDPLISFSLNNFKSRPVYFDIYCLGKPQTGYYIGYQSEGEAEPRFTTGSASTSSGIFGPFSYTFTIKDNRGNDMTFLINKKTTYTLDIRKITDGYEKQSFWSRLFEGKAYSQPFVILPK